MPEENVMIRSFYEEPVVNPEDWPSGEAFLKILEEAKILIPTNPEASNPVYWQACARYTLMKHYDLLGKKLEKMNPYKRVGGLKQLVLTEEEMVSIHMRWQEIVQDFDPESDLGDFFMTGKSNKRTLKWSTMTCKPGCQFKLHAHPNIELVYCARGDLHEVRMKGEPLGKDFEPVTDPEDSNSTKVKGPNLYTLNRPWYFDTISEGEWLVNEVGSVHKSFTASTGFGCILIVLWGGSHADIAPGEEPAELDVLGAVDKMDKKLGECDCTKWDTIEETFLPEWMRITQTEE